MSLISSMTSAKPLRTTHSRQSNSASRTSRSFPACARNMIRSTVQFEFPLLAPLKLGDQTAPGFAIRRRAQPGRQLDHRCARLLYVAARILARCRIRSVVRPTGPPLNELGVPSRIRPRPTLLHMLHVGQDTPHGHAFVHAVDTAHRSRGVRSRSA